MPPSSSVWECCEFVFGNGAGRSGWNDCRVSAAAAVVSTVLVVLHVGGSRE